jgi:hypothetical protein
MDIVERLRERTDGSVFLLSDPPQKVKDALCQEAANEIERLRKIVDKLSDWKEVNGVRVLMKDYYETEIEQLRRVMAGVLDACEDVNSPDRKVREEIAKNIRKALKESE